MKEEPKKTTMEEFTEWLLSSVNGPHNNFALIDGEFWPVEFWPIENIKPQEENE